MLVRSLDRPGAATAVSSQPTVVAKNKRMPGSRFARRLSSLLGDSRFGRRWISYLALERPELLLNSLGYRFSSSASFDRSDWPVSLDHFEDVAPLVLSSNTANRGVSAMSLVEVAHLWRLARTTPSKTLIEIGRERGGSTLVIAAAMPNDAVLHSYDPQSKHGIQGRLFDEQLSRALARYGLDDRVRIHADDSKTATLPDGAYGLILVDGDPTHAGTRRDFERFGSRLGRGGRVLFHDAAAGGPREQELAPLLREIESNPSFERQPDAGTFADFMCCSG